MISGVTLISFIIDKSESVKIPLSKKNLTVEKKTRVTDSTHCTYQKFGS